MHFVTLALASFATLGLAQPPAYSQPNPPAPALTFLYTSYALCLNPIYATEGPRGIRTAIPIVGGNFTGPRLSGKILDVGADWGVTDVQTGIFSADTRYNFVTDDGAHIFLQTSGSQVAGGDLHLRLIFETGDKKYYWMNNVVGMFLLLSTQLE